MRRAALQELARQAATLAEAGSWAPCSTLGGAAAYQAIARQAAGALAGSSGCRPASTAAAAAAQPWLRGLHSQAAGQLACQQQLAAPGWRPYSQQEQQRRGAAAQAAEAPASSGSSGLALSDSAVERLKELQAQVGAGCVGSVCVMYGMCTQLPLSTAVPPARTDSSPHHPPAQTYPTF